MGQLLDQLTKTDFSRAERKEEATGPSKSQKNAKALEPYRDAIGKSKKGGYNDGQGGGGGETDTLQIIAGLYFLFAGLHLVSLICSLWFPSLLGETLERAAVIFIVVTGVLNIGYDIVGGIGILLKKAWGWWLGVFGVGCLAGMTMPFVFLSLVALISIIRGRGNLGTSTILLVVGGVGAAIFVVTCLVLNSIIQPAKMKTYGVKIPKVVAWLISIIGGVALGVAYIAIVLYLGVGDTLINRKE